MIECHVTSVNPGRQYAILEKRDERIQPGTG
jgi:hypothetical protein